MNIFLCILVSEVCTWTPKPLKTCCSILEEEFSIQALQYTVYIASKSPEGRKNTALWWSVQISNLAFPKVTATGKHVDLPALWMWTYSPWHFLQTLKTYNFHVIAINTGENKGYPYSQKSTLIQNRLDEHFKILYIFFYLIVCLEN